MRKVLAAALCAALLLGAVPAVAISASAAETTTQTAQATVQTEASGETLESGGFTFNIYSGNATITGFNQSFYAARVNTNYNTDHKLTIPAEVETSSGEKVPVTDINIYDDGWKDGKESNTFTTVIIPKTVTEILNGFQGSETLEYVTFEEDSNFSSFAHGFFAGNAFQDCKNLKRIGIGNTDKLPNGLKHIGSSTFSGCSSLQSITLPDELESISSFAFQDCTSLKTISIPATVEYLYDSPFMGCTQLESVIFETYTNGENQGKSSLRTLGYGYNGTFENCTNLKTVELPLSTSNYAILHYCFKNTALTGINIPESVTSVDKEAFAGTNLSENGLTTDKGESYGIAFFGKTTTVDDTAFGDVTPIVAGYDNSNADTYAFNHNFKFVSLGNWNPYSFDSPDLPGNTSSTSNNNTGNTSSASTGTSSEKSTTSTSSRTDGSTSTSSRSTTSTSSRSTTSTSNKSTVTSPQTGAKSSMFGGMALVVLGGAVAGVSAGVLSKKRKEEN